MNKPIAGPLTHKGCGVITAPGRDIAVMVGGRYLAENEMTAKRVALSYNTLARLSLGQIVELAHILDTNRSFSILPVPALSLHYTFIQEVV